MLIKSILTYSILECLSLICVFKILETNSSLLSVPLNISKSILNTRKKFLQKVPIQIPELYVYDDNNSLVRLIVEIAGEGLSGLKIVVKPEKDVYFTLHTNEDPAGVRVDLRNKINLTESKFDSSKRTVFITHGWMNSHRSLACNLVKAAFLKYGDHNVILMDWGSVSKRLYPIAVEGVVVIGKYLAESMNYMHKEGLIDLKKTRLVGHSLGAHLIGIAGYHTVIKPLYIIALDPAQPLFLTRPKSRKLSKSSADNVEVVHTNAGLLGMLQPMGHVDFYCNGGTHQIGCIANGACSHSRSWKYYAESINSDQKFYARKCENLVQMTLTSCKGEVQFMGTVRDSLNFTGSYYLKTQANPPFARGYFGI